MQRNKIGQIRFNDEENRVDITLLNDNAKIMMPMCCVKKRNFDGTVGLVVKPGDNFTILQDSAGYGFAYVYNKCLYVLEAPYNCREFVSDLPIIDRLIFANALRREVIRRGDIPSFAAYKNFKRIIRERNKGHEK